MLRLTDRQLDFPEIGVGLDAGKELPKFFERVGLQLGEMRELTLFRQFVLDEGL